MLVDCRRSSGDRGEKTFWELRNWSETTDMDLWEWEHLCFISSRQNTVTDVPFHSFFPRFPHGDSFLF